MKTRDRCGFSWPTAACAAFVLLCTILCFAHFENSAPSVFLNSPWHSPQAASQFAIADFDGDNRPDLATVHTAAGNSGDTRYWIAFQLTGGTRQTLGITAPTGGLRIMSRDVNGDNFLDVVVTTAWTNRPVAVLLNDGQGNFKESNPSAFPEAFASSEGSWTSATDEIKDATAILLSRCPAGECLGDSGFSSHRNAPRQLVLTGSGYSLSSESVSFLGRAPPSFVLNI